jgi:single-strand DNA-binding protein
MNHLTLCCKVVSNEIGYSDRNDPICRLRLKTKFQDGDNWKMATFEAQYFGDRAIDVHTEAPENTFLIVQGAFERYREGADYATRFYGRGMPLLMDFFVPINKIVLVGRMGGSPETQHFSSGAVKAKTAIATNRIGQDSPSWHNIQAWGRRAEVMQQYTAKGSLIGVEGQLLWFPTRDRATGEYLDQLVPFIKADQIKLLDRKREEAHAGW